MVNSYPISHMQDHVSLWMKQKNSDHGTKVHRLVNLYLLERPATFSTFMGRKSDLKKQVYSYVAKEYRAEVGIFSWWFIWRIIKILVEQLLELYVENPGYRPFNENASSRLS